MRTVSACLLTALILIAPVASFAELPNESLVCAPVEEQLDPYRYVRALSLDLTGGPPVPHYYKALDGAGEASVESIVDEMLDSEAFADRVVRRHMDLLWPNVSNVTLTSPRAALARTNNLYWVRNRGITYRGDRVSCLDEPAQWTDDGTLVTTEWTDPADGQVSYREGWVTVEPYWLPAGATIKVCAFDAQAAMVSTGGTECGLREGLNDPGCGCGPELRWCRYGSTETLVREAMAEDVKRRIKAMIVEDQPYTELFTGKRAFVNGPLAFHLRNLVAMHNNVRLHPVAAALEDLPDIPFTDPTFHEVPLGDEHAGILTSWAFLLRFQTNRARANRFYNAFLCEPFQPPAGGIPFTDEEAVHQPDLQKRAGCKYCHSLLEPSSSFWGRWTENGAGYLDAAGFPALREDCLTCALTGQGCSAECNLYYVTKPTSPEQDPYLGKLMSYEFRRPEHEINVEVGPRVLALSAVVDHRLPTCAARRTAEWLLGRELMPEEGGWLDELAVAFVADGYRYRALVKAIIMSETYRRVR